VYYVNWANSRATHPMSHQIRPMGTQQNGQHSHLSLVQECSQQQPVILLPLCHILVQ